MGSRGPFQPEFFDAVDGGLYLGANVPQNQVCVLLLALLMKYITPTREFLHHNLLSAFLFVPQTSELLVLIWNFNTYMISTFHKQQEAFVCMNL